MAVGYFVGFDYARSKFDVRPVPAASAPAPTPEGENACYCQDERPCAFGPGIVGVQRCRTSIAAKGLNVWDDCRPDPRYRVAP